MPRGSPKRVTAVRLDPALVEEVKRHTEDFTEAVEQGLHLWLRQQRRQERAKAKQQQREAA
jgi:hypothetical protein